MLERKGACKEVGLTKKSNGAFRDEQRGVERSAKGFTKTSKGAFKDEQKRVQSRAKGLTKKPNPTVVIFPGTVDGLFTFAPEFRGLGLG